MAEPSINAIYKQPEFIHIFLQIKWKLEKYENKNPSRERQYQEARDPKEMTGNLIINIIKKSRSSLSKNLDAPICAPGNQLPSDIAPYCFDGELIVLIINCFIILLRFIIYCRFDWRHHNGGVSYIFYLNSIFEYFTRDMKCIPIFT